MSLESLPYEVVVSAIPSWYIRVSAATLLAYDYILTSNREITLIWESPWSTLKVLFFLARYLPFCNLFLALYLTFDHSLPEGACRALMQLSNWSVVVGIGASEAILYMRTWALWNRSKGITILLGAVFASASIAVVVIESIWMKSITLGYSAGLEEAGCFVTGSSMIGGAIDGVVILLETVIVLLTAAHLVRQYHTLGRRPFFGGIVGILYRDGIIFFMYMFAISMANFLSVLLGSPSVKNILIEMQHVLHSALGARVLFHLREGAKGHETDKSAHSLPTRIVFVRQFPSKSS